VSSSPNCETNFCKATTPCERSLESVMMMPLPEYAKIKDNYLVCYFGHNKENILQLKILRPFMEKHFPGVKVYFCCNDQYMYLPKDEERVLPKSELKDQRKNFAYVRELLNSAISHIVEDFMEESEIPYGPICQNDLHIDSLNGSCGLFPHGNYPIKSLSGEEIEKAAVLIRKRGCEPKINCNIEEVNWVVGVENEQVYKAGALGKKVSLISNGFGENIFKKMFPAGEIIKL